ncbi:MAG: mannan endo-1,4-beta-mannosidase [Promethearchaeota archaeon CR_4]|nr:MAG: mannan endo-1,4-beta-mannosidase [Candidatus Lokiarchaeota archaeon CR_4]
MRKKNLILVILICSVIMVIPLYFLLTKPSQTQHLSQPVDPNATEETKSLSSALRNSPGILLGVEDENAYEDVKNVTGSYPAFMSLDACCITGDWWITDEGGLQYKDMLMHEYAEDYTTLIKGIRRRGGVTSMVWHQANCVPETILPNGTAIYYEYNEGPHELWRMIPSASVSQVQAQFTNLTNVGANFAIYEEKLATLANFFKNLLDDNGKSIPIIFRPFHENNGGWFWWGSAAIDDNEYTIDPTIYKTVLNIIWRYTIDYFTQHGVHNLLYAISPNGVWGSSGADWAELSEEEYLTACPDLDMVDILGFDIYFDLFGYGEEVEDSLALNLDEVRMVVNLAAKHNKAAAITEIGLRSSFEAQYEHIMNDHGGILYNGIHINNFHTLWSNEFFEPLLNDPVARNISYFAFWTNKEWDTGAEHYAPWPGDPSKDDFINITARIDPRRNVLLEDRLPNMYG